MAPAFAIRTIFAGFQHFFVGSSQTARVPRHIFVSVITWWDALRLVRRSRHSGEDEVRWPSAAWASGELDVGRDMSDGQRETALHPTRIDIPEEIRLYLSRLLNQTLACTVDLHSQVKQASWNVKGREGCQLQALFDSIATELDADADLLADRIVVLGGEALGTARTAARESTLPEYPGDISAGDAHVLALVERVALYTAAVRDAIAHAADVGDAGTAAVYTDISRGIDRRLRCLESHLHQ
jgi:starvation-inducible DNA-binding protein